MGTNELIICIKRNWFNDLYFPYLFNNAPEQVFYGGASSGKSSFLAQRAIIDMHVCGRNYLVLRNVKETLRRSCFNELVGVIHRLNAGYLFDINKSEMLLYDRETKKQAIFAGLDDPEKLKSIKPLDGVLTDIWYEEATEMKRDSVRSAGFRLRGHADVPKRELYSFNPINIMHWISREMFGSQIIKLLDTAERLIVHSTYLDNAFLTDDDIKRIERYKDDEFFWNVYGLGLWGVIGKLILSKIRIADLSGIKSQLQNTRNGLDFGYADDPAACIRSARVNGTIYVLDEFYGRELENPSLAEAIRPIVGDEVVKCDSAEPKSIAELRTCKINAKPVKKRRLMNKFSGSKSSLLFSIQWLRQREIVIDKKCQNFINEVSTWQWKRDRYGEAINPPTPQDFNNHGIDALRYAWEDDMLPHNVGIITSSGSWQSGDKIPERGVNDDFATFGDQRLLEEIYSK